jgi:hypothetical protein
MPVQSFSSFDAFFDAFRFASMRPMVLGPAGEKWVLSSLVLNNNLSIQWGQAEARAVVEGAPRSAGVSIFLPTRAPEAWWWNGRRCDDLSLMVDVPGADFCLAAANIPRSWCGLYIPNQVLADATGDATTTVGSKRGFFQVSRERTTRFRSIVGQLEAVVQGRLPFWKQPLGKGLRARNCSERFATCLQHRRQSNPHVAAMWYREARLFAWLWTSLNSMTASAYRWNSSLLRQVCPSELFVMPF